MKIYLDMVGCRLNQSELEAYARQFRQAGHVLVGDASSADLVVINTCTVTAPAASDSRHKVRHALASGKRQVVVTGCLATQDPLQLANLSPEVRVIGNLEKERLVPMLLGLPEAVFENSRSAREPIPGMRMRTRAFIKAQDGCDNHCTYCVTRLARGVGRSRVVEAVVADVQSALAGGCQEVVLTGVHLGSWGHDFDPPKGLQELVQEILESSPTPRLHLSSIEPWDVSSEFLSLWRDPRLCRHLHLPLQSGCEATLQRMGRKITPNSYAQLVESARQLIPGVSITTDIITGFPGETEQEFEQSLAFVEAMQFSGGHVFTYSPRPGTAAVKLPGQIDAVAARRRNASMRQALQRSAQVFHWAHIGQEFPVLWEKATLGEAGKWQLSGRSDNNLRVQAVSLIPCRNQVTPVRITQAGQDGLFGEILPT